MNPKSDAYAVTQWANRDYASYDEWRGPVHQAPTPLDPDYPRFLAEAAAEARKRYPDLCS